MTRNDDSDFIFAIGLRGSADYFFIPKRSGKLKITDGFTKRNIYQLIPHFLLKRGAFLVHRNIKRFTFAVEKFYQLFRALMHYFADARFAMRYLFFVVNKS